MKEKNILLGQIKEKYYKAKAQGVIMDTDFLDMQQKSMAKVFLKREKIQGVFYGGYESAERCKLYLLPEGITKEDFFAEIQLSPESLDMKILRAKSKRGGRELTHRDYLGSLMGLGIKREKVGDILVRENVADIIVASDIGEYLLTNYDSAGRTKLDVELLPITKLEKGETHIEEEQISVASLRLDGVLSKVFGISRPKAVEAIKMGIVFVNDIQQSESDARIEEGAKLVIRGRGKVFLKKVQGKTRKGRIALIVEKYK